MVETPFNIDISEVSTSELISLIFSNPFVSTKVRNMALTEYNKRMREKQEGNKDGKN